MSEIRGFQTNARIQVIEVAPWLLALLVFFVMPTYLSLGTHILIYMLFAMSLNLVTGFAGIITLGQGAFFGVGAYTCGILSAKLGLTDPFVLLLCSAFTCGVLGLLTGLIVLRTHKLTQLMLTLAIAALCFEVANKATMITGGADGLTGVIIRPILGYFSFDYLYKTAYLWCLIVLFIFWYLMRRIIYSPFGITLVAIKENRQRMAALGVPVQSYLLKAYTLAAILAGIAGALITQTNQFVGLNVISIESSSEVLMMVILGGVGRFYGALLGPFVYLVAQDILAKQYPEYWSFGIGFMLLGVVLYAQGGMCGMIDKVILRGRKQG